MSIPQADAPDSQQTASTDVRIETTALRTLQQHIAPVWLIVDKAMRVHTHGGPGAEEFLILPDQPFTDDKVRLMPELAESAREHWHEPDHVSAAPTATALIIRTKGRQRQILQSVLPLDEPQYSDLRLIVIQAYQTDIPSAPSVQTDHEQRLAHKLRLMDNELASTRAELQNTLDFTRRVLDSLYCFVGVCDLEGNLIEANQAAIKAADIHANDVLNKPFVEAHWWSHSAESQRKLLDAIEAAKAGISSRFDVDILIADNRTATIDFQMVPMFDDDGVITHLVPSAIDVTERRQIELALESSEESMRTLLTEIEEIYSTAPVGLCVIDRDLRYLRINEHLAQINGLSVAEHLGKSVLEIVPDVARNAVDSLEQIFVTGEPLLDVHLSGETLQKPGVVRHWIESFYPLRNKNGEVDRISIVAEEVTDRVHHQDHLESMRNRAERANRAKSEFLANMSHEIRTPMTAILGYADLLSTQLNDADNLQSIETIRRNGLYLIELLDDILDLSRIEANKLELELTEFSPVSVVQQISELMQVRADQQGVTLKIEYPGAVPAMIRNDPTRLRQILVNIVGNAIKFTDNGDVVLSLKYIDHEVPCVQFTIRDTGIGISGEQLKHVYEAFVQADSSISRRYGGSGLGLTICNRLVNHLGGQLDIESEPGLGTVVSVRFPVGLQDDVVLQLPEQIPSPSPDHGINPDIRLPYRILAVDDRADVLALVARLLESTGATVVTADGGEQAIAMLINGGKAQSVFDAVILDMHMPAIDGFEVVRQLRAAGMTIPVIALTADIMNGRREKCLEAGCTDFVTKPIVPKILLLTVQRHLIQRMNRIADSGNIPAGQAGSTVESNTPTQPLNVLIVEDHEPSAHILARLLARHGHSVHCATSAKEARSYVANNVPHVIFSDIGLPDESGFSLVEGLRREPQLHNCCMIALSGSDISRHEGRSVFDAQLRKPVDMKGLLNAIESGRAVRRAHAEHTEA